MINSRLPRLPFLYLSLKWSLYFGVLPYPLKPPLPARGLKYVQLQVNLFFLSVVLVPQFSTELKENPGIFETERQARYAGIIGTRAIFKPRSFAVEDPEIVCDNNADTIATIYRDGFLAHRPMRPTAPRDSTKYRMTLIRSISIITAQNRFHKGETAFRNSREFERRESVVIDNLENDRSSI